MLIISRFQEEPLHECVKVVKRVNVEGYGAGATGKIEARNMREIAHSSCATGQKRDKAGPSTSIK